MTAFQSYARKWIDQSTIFTSFAHYLFLFFSQWKIWSIIVREFFVESCVNINIAASKNFFSKFKVDVAMSDWRIDPLKTSFKGYLCI